MCNCSIIEHYTISKKGFVEYKGSFHSDLGYVEDEFNNFIEVKTSIALSAKGVIIPYLVKFNLLKN